MDNDDKIRVNHAVVRSDRRNFLKRNILAIGAIAATALTDSKPASALAIPPRPRGGNGPRCLLKGTKIRTLDGERKVEDLAIGDQLPAMFGGTRAIKWVGGYACKRDDGQPWSHEMRPVRIAQSAIAPNVPSRDLFVSGGHYLYIDGLLIPASNLVNGTTIAYDRAEGRDELEYYHIKLDRHDVIYAEGMACETLLEMSDLLVSNADDYRRLYGETDADEAPCAPLAYYNGRRGQIVSRLRSAASPWVDRRTRLDVIRDGLEDRATTLAAA